MEKVENSQFSEDIARIILEGGYLECKDLHSGTCFKSALERFFQNASKHYKIFIPIYFIPLLIFHRNRLRKHPIQTIKKTIKEMLGSLLFISGYIANCKYVLCKVKDIRQAVDPWGTAMAGLLSTPFILFEKPIRRGEIILFILPRTIETVWKLLYKRGLIFKVEYWEVIIFGIAMGIFNHYYIHDVKINKYIIYISKIKLNIHTQVCFRLYGIEYINQFFFNMKPGAAILVGTIVYAVIGIIACGGFTVYVSKKTKNPNDIADNRMYLCELIFFSYKRITLVSVSIATFCLWLMWVVAYMAQINPLITPEYENPE